MKPAYYRQQFGEIAERARQLEQEFLQEPPNEKFHRLLAELLECFQKYTDTLEELKDDDEAIKGELEHGRFQ